MPTNYKRQRERERERERERTERSEGHGGGGPRVEEADDLLGDPRAVDGAVLAGPLALGAGHALAVVHPLEPLAVLAGRTAARIALPPPAADAAAAAAASAAAAAASGPWEAKRPSFFLLSVRLGSEPCWRFQNRTQRAGSLGLDAPPANKRPPSFPSWKALVFIAAQNKRNDASLSASHFQPKKNNSNIEYNGVVDVNASPFH